MSEICPVNRKECTKHECEHGVCSVTGNMTGSFLRSEGKATSEEISHSKSEKLTATQVEELHSSVGVARVANMLAIIQQKEPAAFEVLAEVVSHIHGTYGDKYQGDAAKVVDTKYILTKMHGGKWANSHSALKYIQRYISEGYAKSDNPLDLRKAIHYLVFELTRRLHLESTAKGKDIIEK